MKSLDGKIKVLCELTAVIIIVGVFIVGSWLQWQDTKKYNEFPSLQAGTLELTTFISGADLSSPSHIIEKEQALLSTHLNDVEPSPALTDETLDEILHDVQLTEVKDIKVLEPLITDLQSTYTNENKVFIYHTHAREGWHGEGNNTDKNANSEDINITLLGEKLGEELAALGIGSLVSTTDYATKVPGYNWAYSYKYSKKSLKEILAAHEDIEMVFDIHRDSQPRKYTTATINNEDYAQVYFIIGKRNANWEKNEAFAEQLHNKIEELYPGLSRGIWGKNANSGNGEYNQSLHEKNVLIEVGGVDNTLEENYRTIKALAHVISLISKEANQ